jgi:hypothetical protein
MRYGDSCPAILLGFVATFLAAAQSPLPSTADLIAEFNRLGLMPQVQGSDTCSLHAVASLAEFALARRDPGPNKERSTEFLIWAAKKATGKDHDQAMFYGLYCGRVLPSGTLELGVHDFTAGRHRIRFGNAGKNAASAGYSFGIDAIDLLPHAAGR